MGHPLPIIQDITAFTRTPRLPAIPISHALDIDFLLLLEEITTNSVFETAQIYSCLVLEVRRLKGADSAALLKVPGEAPFLAIHSFRDLPPAWVRDPLLQPWG